jgi:hypothetical protein
MCLPLRLVLTASVIALKDNGTVVVWMVITSLLKSLLSEMQFFLRRIRVISKCSLQFTEDSPSF